MPSEIYIATSFPDGASKWLALYNANLDQLNAEMTTVFFCKPRWRGLMPPGTPVFSGIVGNANLPNNIPLADLLPIGSPQPSFLGLTLDFGGKAQDYSPGAQSLKYDALDHIRFGCFGYVRVEHSEQAGSFMYAGTNVGDEGLHTTPGTDRLLIGIFAESPWVYLNPQQ